MRLGLCFTRPPGRHQRLHQRHRALPGLRFFPAEIGDHTRRVGGPRHRNLALLAQKAKARPIRALGQKCLVIAQPRRLISGAQAGPFHQIGRHAAHPGHGGARPGIILGPRQA